MSLLAEYVAVLLLASAEADDEEEYGGSINRIATRLNEKISSSLRQQDVADALAMLEPFGAAERDYSPLTGGFWNVKFDNFRYYFRQSTPDEGDDEKEYARIRKLADAYPILMAYGRRGAAYADDAENALLDLSPAEIERLRDHRSDEPAIGTIPASNRLVTINHNSPEFVEMVSVTEQASESIRSSNSIDEHTRGWIREHLAAGLSLIKKHTILATAASALLLQPLINAYEAVTEEPAKQAILLAINAVRAFFGIL